MSPRPIAAAMTPITPASGSNSQPVATGGPVWSTLRPWLRMRTSEEEFEPREYGEKYLEIRKHVPRSEGPVPVEENVGRDFGVDAGIAGSIPAHLEES